MTSEQCDYSLKEQCSVCDRAQWGEVVRLGYGKWRHDSCYPGSLPWLEYFKALPPDQQTSEGKLIAAHRWNNDTKEEEGTEHAQ